MVKDGAVTGDQTLTGLTAGTYTLTYTMDQTYVDTWNWYEVSSYTANLLTVP